MDRNTAFFSDKFTDGPLQPAELIRLLRTHIRWLAIPAVVCAVLAAGYSLVAPRQWWATQALIVRPEAASVSDEKLGKFSDLSEMKTLQETILELAKSQSVIHKALAEVGAPKRYRHPERWPTALDIDEFRDDIDMRPPGGAEFGKTEVFYLSVRNSNRDRASSLATALCGQLEHRMQELRDARAQSMIDELNRTVAMADSDLAVQTGRLSAFEGKIGADLAEMRNLNAEIGGQGEVSQERQAIESERRANESRLRENQRLLKLLVAAKDDAQQLLATPNSLLVSQPAVSQLKNALVNAQIHTANLLGSRSEKHPFVIAAREAEALLRNQLHDEVAVAIRGLEVDIELNAEREQSLAAKWSAARSRLTRLAESRAEYANLVASVQNHTRLVEAARKNLADARARQAGARSASVISRIDGVEAGVRPAGPSRKAITAAGGVSGLLFGFGLVFLFGNTSPTAPFGFGGAQSTNVAAGSRRREHAHSVVTPDSVGDVDSERSTRAASNSPHSANGELKFGMFSGMTLQEAIRSVDRPRSE